MGASEGMRTFNMDLLRLLREGKITMDQALSVCHKFELNALIDRAALVARANGHLFKRKVGAAVVAVRRGGEMHALDTIHHFFQIVNIYSVGSSYWNFGMGRNIGEVISKTEGVQAMRDLGQNMAWLLNKLGVSFR